MICWLRWKYFWSFLRNWQVQLRFFSYDFYVVQYDINWWRFNHRNISISLFIWSNIADFGATIAIECNQSIFKQSSSNFTASKFTHHWCDITAMKKLESPIIAIHWSEKLYIHFDKDVFSWCSEVWKREINWMAHTEWPLKGLFLENPLNNLS